jgi:hypothetical protein
MMSRRLDVRWMMLVAFASAVVVAPEAAAGPLTSKKLDDSGQSQAHAAIRKLPHCDSGWVIASKHSFRLSGPGDVRDQAVFASAHCDDSRRYAFVTRLRSGEVMAWESHAVHNEPMPWEVEGISFADVNHDGHADLLVAVSAMTGVGPDGAKPYIIMDALISSADTPRSGRLSKLTPEASQAMGDVRTLAKAIANLRRYFSER